MFSIAAINESDSGGKWEPLAPTKEAQEFHLSQTYHEGLLKLQDKDYIKARELLESVLKDPIISSAQVGNVPSDRHLLQLRFLSLKNLATVFLQLGPMHYENALHCYLQATELDETDSVVWNHLGTLSCKMGLLSTSRWAFEQGLLCSPNNWNCMEKLLEVLIAIGDEVACLSVANLILGHWPSHSRALHAKETIEDSEPVNGKPFAARGIDKLEPKHVRLEFPEKRKLEDNEISNINKCKKRKLAIELQLTGATWSALIDAILGIFHQSATEDSVPGFMDDHDCRRNENFSSKPGKGLSGDGTSNCRSFGIQTIESMGRFADVKIDIHLNEFPEITIDPAKGKDQGLSPVGGSASLGLHVLEKTAIVKEKDSSTDREHPQERRSTRIERLRSRKSGKEESEASGKNQANIVFQILEPFVLRRSRIEDQPCTFTSDGTSPDYATYNSEVEHKDVVQFVYKISKNSGAHHVVHLLLEEVAYKHIPFQDSFVKLLELEKLTRNWGQDRSPLCSLFLAEIYYDLGSWVANRSNQLEYLSEASYHLCKVIELVVFDGTNDLIGTDNHFSNTLTMMEMNDIKGGSLLADEKVEKQSMFLSNTSGSSVGEANLGDSLLQGKNEHDSTITDDTAFWVRFFWLSGRLSLFEDSKAKAFNEFCICLTLLRNNKKLEEASDFVFLPHCKLMRLITVDRILHQINLLKLDSLLGKSSDEMMDKGMFMECMNMLSPLLLSTREVYLDIMFGPLKEKDRNMPMELSALNLLISACEKTEQMDLQVYLNCHRRKLQMLTVAAGMESLILSRGKNLLLKSCGAYEVDLADPLNKTWKVLVSEEVKDISRTVTCVKNFIDQGGYNDDFSSLVCVISDIQLLLLTVMCSAIRTIVSQKFSSSVTSGQTDQLESWCLVDAATAFCKLQHLDSFVSIKTQVDLIVAVHDLLADYGLCSSGRDSEGEEGKFLKFAIKHLLALDVKFKQLTGANGQEEPASPRKHPQEIVSVCNVTYDEGEKGDDALHTGKRAELDSTVQESHNTIVGDTTSSLPEEEIEEIELTLDTALDQSFFCLYGLKLNLDSSNEDELAIHKNTNRGEYQTKEQCADVFHYLLPYAKALSRAGLVKLRRVLRAIRKHFPQPPDDMLCENTIDKFLDGVDLWEDKLQEVSGLGEGRELITNIISNARDLETTKRSSIVSSEQYLEVYGNLYYFIAQAEEISAIDKYAGFVLKKEGEEFVEQSANLFKYDLLYNPLRFESWQKLANIYDEEVDLLLNDGSKHISVLDWKKNTALHQRVEAGRRRSRRCLLMSLALASTPSQQSQIHELLALVYYDSLQSVVPFYDQRSIAPTKESSWMEFCKNSMKHFEKAFVLKSEWLHAFYLGKLCQKMGQSPVKALSYFNKAALLNPSGVDPVYRMHASRMKLLYIHGYEKIDILQAVAAHVFHQSTRETILDMFQMSNEDLMQFTADTTDVPVQDDLQKRKNIDPKILENAWHLLYDDCLAALRICVEGELKHFHKARYILAKGLYRRGESGDVERAKEELSFCFKSSRSSFTVNMWEIDGMARKGRRKNPGLAGNKKCLELSLSESSRKFITCVRKYLLFYLNLLEKTGELSTLERAYSYIKTDKRFALCLGDIIPVALGKYIQVLISSIRNTENYSGKNNPSSMEQMLEKLFNIFMDHANMWTDIITLPELKMADLSESNLYSYIHQYIHLLETDIRLDALEAINERIRKRFKNPKLTNNNLAKICKHASLAWCRSIAIKLALITPLTDTRELNHKPGSSENSLLLFVDLQPDELMVSQSEGTFQSKGLDMNWFEALCKIKNVQVRQALEENMEAAVALMKCTYNFYRDSSCGTLPMGINVYTTCFSQPSVEGLQQQGKEMVNILDLSIPRKLLLWAYTLVHGRYSNISTVVKYFEDARARMKRGTVLATTSPANVPTAAAAAVAATVTHAASGACREKPEGNEHAETEDTPLCSTALHSEETVRVLVPALSEAQKSAAGSSQLQRCSTTKSDENTDGWSGS
ncbi:calcineurin-binding protein 1-like isoform X1 [Zingiber officinale]|nr:calcineurin-binding protein 1-like isoform X1 [Zingiber officinale]